LKKNKSNNLLKLSVFISIAIHVIAIASINRIEVRSYLATNNIMFSNKAEVLPYTNKNTKQAINVVLKQKQKNIQQRVNQSENVVLKSICLPSAQKSQKIKNHYAVQNSPIKIINFNFRIATPKVPLKLIEEAKALPMIEMEKSSVHIPSVSLDAIAQGLKKSREISSLPKNEQEQKIALTSSKELLAKNNSLAGFQFEKDLKDDEQELLNNLTRFTQRKVKLFPRAFSLIDVPKLNDLTTLPYKDFFNIEVTFAPRQDDKGFIFAITLIPKSSIRLNRLKQNIFFLVDRSNSIQKERLTSTRHAITSSLSMLEKEDSFNILAFDTKLDVLSAKNLNPDNISFSRAKGFLRKQNIGSFFSSTNFSIPFYKILDNNVKKDEINIAILLSNGDGLNKFKNYRVINEWTKLNGGNLSLFTIGLNNDKNLSILELFSFLNKGKLISSTTNRGIKRKLQKLLKSINYPIAKDLVTNVICLDKTANITLYPPSHQSPHLYLNEPYVILGTIDKIQDFTIFVQGKSKEKFFNLKKHISFDDAKQGGKILPRELAIKQASLCYEKYLADNNPNHLHEASNHLEPFEITPTFK